MHPSAVQEHGCEKRKKSPDTDIHRLHIRKKLRWNHAEMENERIQMSSKRELIEEKESIRSDERTVYEWRCLGWIGIAEGNQEGSSQN